MSTDIHLFQVGLYSEVCYGSHVQVYCVEQEEGSIAS